MEYSFPHYLLSKQSVDDRALNKDVFNALKMNLPPNPMDIIEIGAGIGTMLTRLIDWKILNDANYLLIDEMAENIENASEWIPQWAQSAGLGVERIAQDQLRVFDETRDIHIQLQRADIFDFIKTNPPNHDLLIAHAVLDLFPMPESLPKLFSLTKNLAWFTVNFDGVTTFEPGINAALDEKIERLYHHSMDTRSTGGDSKSGRHLFKHLQNTGAELLAAGSSDWVVYPKNRKYPADEAYFLNFILHFIEETLGNHADLDADEFTRWLKDRRAQIEGGELVYIAHQMDFLAKV